MKENLAPKPWVRGHRALCHGKTWAILGQDMRILLVMALFLASPAQAWQAGIEGPLCTLTHAEPDTAIRLTYDPAGPLYSISVTTSDPWPQSAIFGIAFLGGLELTITTNRHVLSDGDRTLTVTDQGFGNVLDGLAQNQRASIYSGATSLSVSLADAAPEVAAFRACTTAPSA